MLEEGIIMVDSVEEMDEATEIEEIVITSENGNGIVEDKGTNEGNNDIFEPKVGMKFGSINELFEYFKGYANKMGFPMKRRTSKKDDDGNINYLVFACSREGKKPTTTAIQRLRNKPTIRAECNVKLSAKLGSDGKWQIKKVNLEHTHALLTPNKVRFIPSNRVITGDARRRLIINDIAGIKSNESYKSIAVEEDGVENVGFIQKDARNLLDKDRRLRLGEGDASAVQSYFLKMQAANCGFFFSYDLDEKLRLKNVFWAEGRSREAYKEFGDVVTFDTTYLTNKYAMPFAPFVGVNHHGETILFGCGLISNEDTDTFVWLFKTWLTCMGGIAPKGIITDQDRAMQKAIHNVFPNTEHRWCLWHILMKIPEKLKYHKHYGTISTTMLNVVYDSQNPFEFDKSWGAMIAEYKLENSDWLNALYNERKRWVPGYVKVHFWAGMSTTQRSEGVNAFFDGFVDSKTTLKQFVEQYENALRSKVEKENYSDYRSASFNLDLRTSYEFEKQAREVYTLAKFQEFQRELIAGITYCEIMRFIEGAFVTEYHVREDVMIGEYKKRVMFVVSCRLQECEFKCSCNFFEFKGLLCRHVIKVFIRDDVLLIPDKYILRRWRKDVPRCHSKIKVNHTNWHGATEDQQRYDQMYRAFTKVIDMASTEEKLTSHVLCSIDALSTELSTMMLSDHVDDQAKGCEENASQAIRDPLNARTKGQTTRLRSRNENEKLKKKKKLDRAAKKVKDGQINKRDFRTKIVQHGRICNSSPFEVPGLVQENETISLSLNQTQQDSQYQHSTYDFGGVSQSLDDFGGVHEGSVEGYKNSASIDDMLHLVL